MKILTKEDLRPQKWFQSRKQLQPQVLQWNCQLDLKKLFKTQYDIVIITYVVKQRFEGEIYYNKL
jgi:hypothetical protein